MQAISFHFQTHLTSKSIGVFIQCSQDVEWTTLSSPVNVQSTGLYSYSYLIFYGVPIHVQNLMSVKTMGSQDIVDHT